MLRRVVDCRALLRAVIEPIVDRTIASRCDRAGSCWSIAALFKSVIARFSGAIGSFFRHNLPVFGVGSLPQTAADAGA
jgi:hypothetical protein